MTIRRKCLLFVCVITFCFIWFQFIQRPTHSQTPVVLRRLTTSGDEALNLNPALSGNGRRVAFESTEDFARVGGGEQFRALRGELNSGGETTFTQMAAARTNGAPALSQDGNRIAFASSQNPLGANPDGNPEIFLYDGTQLKQITNTTADRPDLRSLQGNFSPSISDDGNFIAFHSNRNPTGNNPDGNTEIFICNIVLNALQQFTASVAPDANANVKISGNGNRLAYIREFQNADGTSARGLFARNRNDANAELLSSAANVNLPPGRAVSDDGLRVAFTANDAGGRSQVFLSDRRVTNSIRQISTLTTPASLNDVPLNPTISGDGTRIAFATRRTVTGFGNSDNSVELYLYDLTLNQFQRLTNAPAGATGEVVPALNDEGSIVVFHFPRLLSGAVNDSASANNPEIYSVEPAPRPAFGALTVFNAATFNTEPAESKTLAPGSLAVAQGTRLATATQQTQRGGNGTFPLNVAGTSVSVNNWLAQIFYVSPTRINFQIPPNIPPGAAEIVVTNPEGFQSRANVMLTVAAPGLFAVNAVGTEAGVILDADTLQAAPFDPTNGARRLIIFATGMRNAAAIRSVTIGGRQVTVEAVVANPDLPGLDQIHVLLPSELRGAGVVPVTLSAEDPDGQTRISNIVTVELGGAPADIVINEVLADPPGSAVTDLQGDANRDGTRSAGDDEFIEIVNSTPRDMDVGGYQLFITNSNGAPVLRHTFTMGTLLPASSAAVVFGGGNPNPANPVFGGAQIFTASTGSLALPNGGATISLRQADGATLTSFTYGGTSGLNGGADQSLTRSPDTTGGFRLHSTATGANGAVFSPGTRINGAPFVPPQTIARIEITPAAAEIQTGATQQFTARTFDANGNLINGVIFAWSSSDITVATVNRDGLATGVGTNNLLRANATIRATARGISGAAILTVNPPPRVLTRIEVTPLNATIPTGGQRQFIVRAFDQENRAITGVTFIWSSSNANVASVDANGLATATANVGTAVITAASQNVSGDANLNVFAPTIVINEVLADPPGSAVTDLQGDANRDGARSAGDDEFIEFTNASDSVLSDIAGWKIFTRGLNSTTETLRHTFAANTIIAPNSAAVVFGGGSFDPNNLAFGCARIVGASSGGLSLTNSGVFVILRDAENNLIAQFSYGGSAGLNGDNDQSLTRAPDTTGVFALHTAADGASGRRFSPGLRVNGTPFGNCDGRLATIAITPLSAQIITGNAVQFTARAFDNFGRPLTGTLINFAASNSNVAAIESVITDASGVALATVRGISAGTSNLAATGTQGAITVVSETATLTVTPPPVIVARIAIAPVAATVNRGATQQFTATAFDQNNQIVPNAVFTWTSNNAAIATVDASGLATGIGVGTANISATTNDGQGGTSSGQAALTVQIPLVINEILADPAGNTANDLQGDANRDGIRDGDDDEFVELFNNSNAAVNLSGIVLSDAAANRFTFPSNTTLAAGRAAIIFGGGNVDANDPAFGGAATFTASSLSLNNGGDSVTLKLNIGGVDVVIATQTYAAEGGADQALTRAPDVAVGIMGGNFVQHTAATNAAGRLFSLGTRADGTPFGSPVVTRIEVSPASVAVEVGGTQTFTARAFGVINGSEIEIPNVSFVWDSGDATRATVGVAPGATTNVLARAAGQTTIRARTGGRQGSASLTVNAPPVLTSIVVSPASANVNIGGAQQFVARAFDQFNNELTDVAFTWNSGNPNIAMIDANGLATGVNPGMTNITAVSAGVTSNPAQLTVNAPPRVLTRIGITPQTANIPTSGQRQFTARAFDQFDQEITGVAFAWVSSDESVATIEQNGLATANNHVGAVTITAAAQNVIGTATLNVFAPTIVINEILADPAGATAGDLQGDANRDGTRSASDDEFIEFVNASATTPSDLSGWKIFTRAPSSSTETLRHTFAPNTILAPNNALTVFGGGSYDPNNPAFGCARIVSATTGGLSLTNSGLIALLRDGENNLIAQFAYGMSTGLNGDADQSLTRAPDAIGNFALHTTASGAGGRRFSPGLRVNGTPFGECAGQLSSVTLAPPSAQIVAGNTTQFIAGAFDNFGRPLTNANITFAVSNPLVATIVSSIADANGVATATVRGETAGASNLNATVTLGVNTVTSDAATLTVVAPPTVITRVEVAPLSATVNRGMTQQFTAVAFDQNNQPVPDAVFTWSSGNNAIATVKNSGLATGNGLGAVNITATANDGQGGTISGQATLNVQIPLIINEIHADPAGSATSDLQGDANRDGARDTDDDEFVELLNNSTAPVDVSGVVVMDATSNRFSFPANTLLAAGRAVVIFGGGNVNANDPNFGGALIATTASLGLNNGGDTVALKLNVGGNDVIVAAQTYGAEGGQDQALTRSPDAAVGANGGNFVQHTVATTAAGRLFSPGTRADGAPFGSPAVTRIEAMPATATLEIGQTQIFTARAFGVDGGSEVEIPNVSFIWDSSAPSVATVSVAPGQTTTATALAAGQTMLRGRAGGQQGVSVLTVNAPPPVLTTIQVTPSSATIQVGNFQQFTARAFDQNNSEISGVAFTWNSSDTGVATVNQNGLATGVTAGATNITASAQSVTSNNAVLTVTPAQSGTPSVVISQIYGGGGNSGAPFRNDFIEIYNRGSAPQDLTDWSVQYTSATGTGTWQVTNLSGMLQPGQYLLIQEGGGANGAPLPTPDVTGTIAMAATAGKVAVLNTTTALTGAMPVSTNIKDLVGYGTANFSEGASPAPAPSNTTSIQRAGNGCTDTNNNAADFAVTAPNPRNRAAAFGSCANASVIERLRRIEHNFHWDSMSGDIFKPEISLFGHTGKRLLSGSIPVNQ